MALDFNFTDEQKMLEDSVYRWAITWLEPQMEHLYEIDEMPKDLFKETANLGINGIVIGEKYGGAGLGYVEALLAYETIARVSNALSMTVVASQTLCFDNIHRNATEAEILSPGKTGALNEISVAAINTASDKKPCFAISPIMQAIV